MSNLVDYAKKELDMIDRDNTGMQDMMNENILYIVKAFSEQEHSGFSGSYVLGAIKRLLNYKPLLPLTGEDNEWVEVGGGMEQNRRHSTVFRKDKDNSTAYDIEGKVFSDDGGETWFTSKDSIIPIKFPYTVPESPEHVIIK